MPVAKPALLIAAATLLAQTLAPATRAAEVQIRKDRHGVPYILAGREEDAFYGLGYAQADDRIDLVLKSWLAAEGRLAEVEGEKALAADYYARHFFSLEEARDGYGRLPPQLQRNLRAFVAGVKAWMAEHPRRVPAWAPAFGPEHILLASNKRVTEGGEVQDCAAGGGWYGLGLGLDPRIDVGGIEGMGRPAGLSQALNGLAPRRPEISNSAALAPSRLQEGVSALLGDPHSGGYGGAFFEFVLRGGDYAVAGITDPGNFITTLGNGPHIAWTATSGGTDSSDCFLFREDPGNPDRLLYGEGSKSVVRQSVTFGVKGGKPIEAQQAHVLHNGVLSPIVARANGLVYVLSPGNRLDPAAAVRQIYEIAKARSVDDAMTGALTHTGAGSETQTFADSSGNILIIRQGKGPRRKAGLDYGRPVPARPETEWQGLHGPEDFAHIRNPANGILHGNNEEPWTWSAEGALDPTTIPSYLSNVVIGFDLSPLQQGARSQRFAEALSGPDRLAVEDLISLALDRKVPGWAQWRHLLETAFPPALRSALPADEQTFLAHLLAFDGLVAPGSEAALRAAVWLEHSFGVVLPPPAGLRITRNLLSASGTRATDLIWIRQTLAPAAAELARRRGSRTGRLTMGDLYRIKAPGSSEEVAFRAGEFTVGGRGSELTELYASTAPNYWFDPPASNGVSYLNGGGLRPRLVLFTSPLTIYSLLIPGQSVDPRSPNHFDQARMAAANTMKRVPFEEAEVRKATRPWKRLMAKLPQ